MYENCSLGRFLCRWPEEELTQANKRRELILAMAYLLSIAVNISKRLIVVSRQGHGHQLISRALILALCLN